MRFILNEGENHGIDGNHRSWPVVGIFVFFCHKKHPLDCVKNILYNRQVGLSKVIASNERIDYNHFLMSKEYRKILIIKPSALGDIALALPVLAAMRRNFSDAKISWLIRPEFAGLLEGHEYIEELIPFDRKFLGKSWYNPKAFAALIRLILKLRREKFDAVADLQGLFRTGFLSWVSGCRNRYGMIEAREFAGIFYNRKVDRDEGLRHLVDRYMKIVGAMGAEDLAVDFVFAKDGQAEGRIEDLLTRRGVEKDNYAVLIPGSAHESKCWPAGRFAKLADRIADEYGMKIVAAGTRSEGQIIEAINNQSRADIINLAGETSLKELAALLRGARIVVGNDTGPSHIAACMPVNVVVVYGWSNPWRISPYGRDECVAAGGLASRGHKIKSDKDEHSVLSVSVEGVFEKVREQLG